MSILSKYIIGYFMSIPYILAWPFIRWGTVKCQSSRFVNGQLKAKSNTKHPKRCWMICVLSSLSKHIHYQITISWSKTQEKPIVQNRFIKAPRDVEPGGHVVFRCTNNLLKLDETTQTEWNSRWKTGRLLQSIIKHLMTILSWMTTKQELNWEQNERLLGYLLRRR